jgi:TPR repeat protein
MYEILTLKGKINMGYKFITALLLVLASYNSLAGDKNIEETMACSWSPQREILPAEELECLKKASNSGNGYATAWLSNKYEKGDETLGVLKDEQEAIKLKLLAYSQGDLGAKIWYLNQYTPPKPYKWKIGMSKKQVLNSVDGAPKRVIKNSSAEGVTETWVYTGAYLFFGTLRDSYGTLINIQEIQ